MKILKSLLDKYTPNNALERVFKIQMFELLNNCDDSFDRSCRPGHFTASCWLVSKDNAQALMLHHAKLDKWLQLGGHCDGDSDVLAVAIKEAQEESGIQNIVPVSTEIFDLDIHLIPQIKEEQPHYHYDVRFILKVDSDEEVVSNRESKALQWFGKNRDELPTSNPSVIRMFDKWVSQV